MALVDDEDDVKDGEKSVDNDEEDSEDLVTRRTEQAVNTVKRGFRFK